MTFICASTNKWSGEQLSDRRNLAPLCATAAPNLISNELHKGYSGDILHSSTGEGKWGGALRLAPCRSVSYSAQQKLAANAKAGVTV